MFAEPGGQIVVAAIAVIVENHDHRAHFAVDLPDIADEDFAIVPVADGLAQIDAIEQRRSERLDRGPLFGQHALAFFLEEAAEIFDDHVFGRVGADVGAVEFAGPFAGKLFLLARL